MVDYFSKCDLTGEHGDAARKSATNDALQTLTTTMEEDDDSPPNHDRHPPTKQLLAPTSPRLYRRRKIGKRPRNR